MHLDQRFANGKAESEPFSLRFQLLERLKDFVQVFWLDAGAGVRDLHGNRLWRRIVGPDGDRAIFGREFAGVPQNIPKDLLHPWRIDIHPTRAGFGKI